MLVWQYGIAVSQGSYCYWVERSRTPKNTRSGSRIFYATPEVQLNHFLHRAPKLGILIVSVDMVRVLLKLNFIEAENSWCMPRFPLIASCHKIFSS